MRVEVDGAHLTAPHADGVSLGPVDPAAVAVRAPLRMRMGARAHPPCAREWL